MRILDANINVFLPKVKNDHDDEISKLLDEAGLVVIALPLLVAKHLLNIECVVC